MKFSKLLVVSVFVMFLLVRVGTTQTKPDDKPSINIGATLFTDYTYTFSPTGTDSDGNNFNPSAFNVTRGYLNVTGKLSHLVAFRFTPDISRETGSGSSLNGSMTLRVKYAFAQFNLDEYTGKGSWARFGIQQTPYLDYTENIYRYRFQGTMFVEREGYFASADAGASFHYDLPKKYGDLHVGYFNGENYNKSEVNDQKGIMIRTSFRPLPNTSVLKGLRVSIFYDGDNYVRNAERKRLIGQMTFEHPWVNAGVEYLNTNDQISITKLDVHGQGYSLWATPKFHAGWEGLLRYDHLTPNTDINQKRNRTILGAAYWFPHSGNVSSALMVDYDGQTFTTGTAQKKFAVHALVNF